MSNDDQRPVAGTAQPSPNFYSDKTDMEVARHINLSLLMCSGISDSNVTAIGYVTTINQKGLDAIARIIGEVRAATSPAPSAAGEREDLEPVEIVAWLRDTADVMVNSLHCSDGSITIAQTHSNAHKRHEIASIIEKQFVKPHANDKSQT